ncbi:MaoC/PaaZ C-terminal domain-containing protein [Mycolicibacterium sp.]|uniref:MaoC/PaaZ C-terminal domain-containing protein n=1 Tax=Mycolicibacterium sp. TaxID=2320850 RepID=UPI001A2E5C1E|nr:MaoC/PaaZ C-terminal domain-containing protein [Mycolicibacterium sp.]MBJ7336535.1 MaoC family dehydratase N-terminal domain-containing protein [Mycolicibacterium sp.]
MTTATLSVGTEAPPRDVGPLTRQMFVRYSGASGDLNPMHYDDEFARSAGHPSVFAQGMFSAALLAGFATDWLGAPGVRRFGVRFREQVWPGDVLTCSGTVTAIAEEDDAERVSVELTATRQTGGVAISGTAEFLVPRNASRGRTSDAHRP